MFLGKPIFMGKSSKDQLVQIIKVLGSPNEEEIQSMRKANIQIPFIEGQGLKNVLTNEDEELIDLLQKVFQYDPKKRIRPF